MKLITALVAAALALGTFLVPLAAAETVTKTWIQTSQTDFLQGTGEGVDVHSSPGNVRMGGAELPTQLSKWRHDQGGYVWSQQGSPYVLSGEGSIYWGRSVSWCSYCRYTDVLTTDAAGKESVTVYLYAAGGYASGYYNAYERAYFRFSDGANTQNFLLRAIELDHWSSGYRNVFGNYQAVETHNGWSWYKFVFDVPSHFNKANLRAGLVLESYTGGTWSCGCNLEMWNYVAFGAPATGMFTSNVHNAGGFADFESIRYSGIVPAGASLRVQTRTSADGVAFSPWADALSGEPLPSPAGHFVQYRVLFSRASLTSAPYLEDVSVTYGFTVDTTAPRTVANAVGPLGCSGWMNGPATVTASATDDLSGVASTLVSVDGGFFAPYAEPFAVGDGEHAVDYYSVDHAGNVEAARAIAFKVDSAAPVSAIDVGAPSYRGDRLYVTPDTPFTLHADDATSGVKVTRVDTGGGFRAYDAPFRLAEEGARTVRYQSEDRACNAEAERVLDVVVDATAPVTTATVLGDAGCDGWLVSRPVVSLDASDALSGVAATYVSVDGGAFAPYAGPVAFDDGRHSVSYYSVDRAGNAEAPRTVDVKADTAPPATTHAIDGATFEADRLYVGPTTAFTLAAEDATSGVKATRVDVGSGFAAYAGPFSLGTDGAYTVSYASEDAACLVEEARAFDVFVDGTAPSVAITSPTSGVRALGHESADVEELDLAQAQLAEFGLYGSDVDTLVHIARVGAAEVCGAADADRCAALALAALAPRVGGPVIVGDVTIRADAADPDVNGGASGLAYVAFYLDGAIQAVDAEAPFEWAWNSANATMGGHDVAALAMDNLGNSATSVVSVSVVPIGATGALDTGDAALVTAEAPVFSQLLYDFVRAKLSGASGVRPPLPEPPVLPAPPPEVCVEGTCIMVPGVPPVDPPPEVPTPPLPPLPEPPTEVCVEGTCVPLAPPGVPDCVGDICPPIDEPVKPCFEPCIPTVPPLPEPPTEVCVEGACLPPDPDALPALPGLPPGVPPPPPTLPPVEPPAVPPVDPPALPPADPPADPPAIPEPQPPSAPDTGELPETPTAPEVPPVCIDDQCLAVEG